MSNQPNGTVLNNILAPRTRGVDLRTLAQAEPSEVGENAATFNVGTVPAPIPGVKFSISADGKALVDAIGVKLGDMTITPHTDREAVSINMTFHW